MPASTLQARIDAAATPALAPYMAQAGDDHGVPGVRAAFLMAPAIVQAFTPAQLRALPQPVSVLLGDADAVAPPSTNGEVLAALAPQATLRALPGVGHYEFLAACTPLGRQRLAALCPPEAPQAAAHAAAIAQALQVFGQALAPVSSTPATR
jgi:pimeloyl-ACP methyl ester carboxylesterase